MGRTNVYGERSLVWVQANSGAQLNYGFKTNIDATEQGQLGHTVVNPAALVENLVIGARLPRPQRMTKRTLGVTSFVHFPAIATARTAGWRRIEPPKSFSMPRDNITGATNARPSSVVCVVNVRGVSFGWNMPGWQYLALAAELDSLGVTATDTLTDAGALKFTLGVGKRGFPVPARALKADEATGNNYETYFDESLDLPADWIKVSPAITTLA